MLTLLSQLMLTTLYLLSGLSSASFAGTESHLAQDNVARPIQTSTISSAFAGTPPRLDGVLDFGEWPVDDAFAFEDGLLAVRNDDLRLYIMLDLLADTIEDAPLSMSPWGDRVWLTIDVNGDGLISSDVDLRYTLQPGTVNLRQQRYLGPGTWTPLDPTPLRSAVATGFDCFFADESRSVTVVPEFPFPFVNCLAHRIWELGIDLAEIGAGAGQTVRMGVSLSSQNPSFTIDVPANLHYDFGSLVEVQLTDVPNSFPTADVNATVDFQTALFDSSMEITQALQDVNNSLPLVEAKSTAVRLYMNANNTAEPQPVSVYLYGTQEEQDLPGSPLTMRFNAPIAGGRSQLEGAANLLLPDSWARGSVELRGRIVDASGRDSWSTPLVATFQPTTVPTYWIIPINTNTAEQPLMIEEDEINQQESYLRAVFPVAEVNFVRKNWQEVGPISSEDLTANIGVLKRYERDVQLAWNLSVQKTGEEPFTLPDAIYGIRLGAGGLSDPVWNGGGGRVAVGGERASSQEGTMAHELTHILDTSSRGAWGRHSPGCNTSGVDPQWPYADETIQDVGFDVRLPWSINTTTVDRSRADLMSYCFSTSPPAKWISPYRWRQLYNEFRNQGAGDGVRGALHEITAVRAAMETVLYIAGEVNVDGTGKLDPIWVQPGIPTQNIASGNHALDVLNGAGETLQSTPFLVSFVDVEGDERSTVRFSFQLAQVPDAAQFVLRHVEETLDSIVVSAHPPTVTVLAPNGDEAWNGIKTIRWHHADRDGDARSFKILYSPNDGERWEPLSGNLSGDVYMVDTNILPGGERARIRVIVTDGFHTVTDDSDAVFSVAKKPPHASIEHPPAHVNYASGELISLVGRATDLEDATIPDRSFIWSYGGESFASGRRAEAILPDGVHEIVLTVIDSDGDNGQDSTTVTVGHHQIYLPLYR